MDNGGRHMIKASSSKRRCKIAKFILAYLIPWIINCPCFLAKSQDKTSMYIVNTYGGNGSLDLSPGVALNLPFGTLLWSMEKEGNGSLCVSPCVFKS